MIRILFVCTGNICRSPTGEGVFRHLLAEAGLSDRIETDSCGMGAWHVGEAPDPRTVKAARARGIDLSDLRARKIRAADFHDFDYLLAMDRGHYDEMVAQAPVGTEAKIRMFLEPVAKGSANADVPDPYYGGADGFELVLDLIDEASRAWIDQLKQVR
ncbi:low molecular weight protein-tyrosine-phosphatase [Aestuariispira insulae]|uniref:protein-tyrosine-phosphatase n=1 Tax=Aestuariispira insulae TaxID=1461337 RepID=A0A3D9HPM4_9PROT|nr:low molecular weight protein-tyrosine-phosphatase [Aestuariispira insulae]RED51261.1 protein-tyrosine phosphatase [Aestuariispira insulae]